MHYRLCAIHFIGSATGHIKLRSIFPDGDDRGAPCHFTAYQNLGAGQHWHRRLVWVIYIDPYSSRSYTGQPYPTPIPDARVEFDSVIASSSSPRA